MKTMTTRSRIHWESFLLGVAVTVLFAVAGVAALNAWSDSVSWRVHHVPMLSTASERAFVSGMDALHAFRDGLEKARREFLSQ